ncbi:MAG: MFS transporter [Hyphomicrobiales bacterium]
MSSTASSVALPTSTIRTALAFALLFAIESLARATIATVISIQAYDIVKSAQQVSEIYTVVGLLSLCMTLFIPTIIRLTARRFVYSFGAFALILAALAFASFTLPGQVVGMLLRVFGAACLNVTLNLYIMDNIPKAELVRSEPLRLSLSTFSWTLGPTLGVWLYAQYGPWAPQAFSAFWSAVLLLVFWRFRLIETIRPGAAKPPTPLRSISRFIVQPRLRLAWLIAFGRSCFWSTFFVYGPLLMVTSGLGKEAGGILISAGNVVLAGAMLFGKLAERIGVRKVITGSFIAVALASFAAGVAGLLHAPVVAAAFLLVAATGAASLDGVGAIPFLKAVRARERPQMTAVYRTYLELSDLLPSAVYAVVLLFAPLSTTFILMSAWLCVCAYVSWRYLPKSL